MINRPAVHAALVPRLLLLLDQVTQTEAARGRDIRHAVALEVVPGADVGALHGQGHPVEAEAAGGPDTEALRRRGT